MEQQGHHDNPLKATVAVLSKFSEGTANPTMPIQHVRAFLHVAIHGEVLQSDLEEAIGIAQSSVSRAITILGEGWPNEPGHGLLESFADPWNHRRKLVRLTEKGKALAWDTERSGEGR
jgi:DNA-binding MarR family transcriptional regulator